MLPVLTTKTEDPDGLDSTVELVECSPEQKIERVESFPTVSYRNATPVVAKFKNENLNSHEILKYSQIETIEIQNDARDENVTIYTTSQVQGTSASKKHSCSRLILKTRMFLNTVHHPICGFFISQKSVHKSGFVHKSSLWGILTLILILKNAIKRKTL